jgi:hypothetical protein
VLTALDDPFGDDLCEQILNGLAAWRLPQIGRSISSSGYGLAAADRRSERSAGSWHAPETRRSRVIEGPLSGKVPIIATATSR